MNPKTDTAWPGLLLEWYQKHRRELPWREDKNPYRIWVSEIMLQQTRVEAVRPYFENWMRQFPTLQSVAEATEEEILTAWQGLGYYSRARNLQQGMRQVMEVFAGRIPHTVKELRTLKGVGAYTAGAIASIAFQEPEVAIDGNVLRIYARLYGVEEDILSTSGQKEIRRLAQATLPQEAPGDFNEALMDFGSAICIPKVPRCESCPLQPHCQAYQEGLTDRLPIRKKKKPPKDVFLKTLLIVHQGRFLLHRRPAGGVLRDMWEFPTWEWNPQDDSHSVAALPRFLQRLVKEGIPHDSREKEGILSTDTEDEIRPLGQLTHTFSHLKWHMSIFGTVYLETKEALPEDGSWQWVSPREFTKLPWAGPHGKITTYC